VGFRLNNLIKKTNERVEGQQDILNPNSLDVYRWVILFVTTFTQATIGMISLGVGSLGPFIVTELQLTNNQLGFIGGAVNLGTTLTALLAGRAVDLWGEKKVLVIGGFATGVSILLASFANSFVSLVAFLVFTGLWAATSTPAGSKAIMTWFPFSQRGFALGIRQTGVPLGGMLAALIMPPIALHFGWKTALVAMCVGAFLGAGVCQLAYKDFPQNFRNAKGSSSNSWTQLLRNKNLWLVGLSGMAYSSVQFTLITYLVLYLKERTGLSVALASLFLALVQFGGIIGRIFWGYASDTHFRGKRKPVMGLIGIIASGMSLVMLLLSEGTPLWLLGSITWVFGFTGIGWNGIYVTLLSELAGKNEAGTAVGMGLSLLQIGVLIFPPFFGLLVDVSGSYEMSWIGLSLLIFVGVLILTRVKETS
jgi:sugar phosphate permease